jgi:metal-dependent amidase/aminoacylase/carboxypeptidase family protein
MDDLINLRRELQANPELSGAELKTTWRIASFFQNIFMEIARSLVY